MIEQGKERFAVTAYDHRNESHDRGTFETEHLAYEEARRIKMINVPKTFYCVTVSCVSSTGVRIGMGPV